VASTERVTVTLSSELVNGIDRLERNRSRFVAEAVERELARRRREGLRRSLNNPHPESAELADMGVTDWGRNLPAGDDDLVDPKAGKPVRWVEGKGWLEGPK
jgi:post-segregation antitoxin (ccd killing protein)